MKKHKGENLLDFIPAHTEKHNWVKLETGIVQIQIERNTWLDRLVRVFAKTPKQMKIDLDEYGSKVWLEIDGKTDVHNIGKKLKESFGEEIEPLYPRLAQYINILKNNKFITFVEK